MDTLLDIQSLQSNFSQYHWRYQAEVTSTNDLAKELLRSEQIREPTVVVAEQQTKGRGRGRNQWWTGQGSLAFSLVFFDEPGDGQASPISLTAGVAVVEAVQSHVRQQVVGLHWPNDIFVGSKKISGILTERVGTNAVILGIGVNVNNSLQDAPSELNQKVISLVDLLGEPISRTEFLQTLLRSLTQRLVELRTREETLLQRFNQLCLQHGKILTVEQGIKQIRGMCLGIAEDGGLMLDTLDGLQTIYSGALLPS